MKDLSKEELLDFIIDNNENESVLHEEWSEARHKLLDIIAAGEQAVKKVAELEKRAESYGNYGSKLEMREAELLDRIAELEKQLAIACHVKTDDKVSFDWAVLTKIDELEKQNSEMARQLAEPAGWQIEKDRLGKFIKGLESSFDQLAKCSGWSEERGKQTGDSPFDIATENRKQAAAGQRAIESIKQWILFCEQEKYNRSFCLTEIVKIVDAVQ